MDEQGKVGGGFIRPILVGRVQIERYPCYGSYWRQILNLPNMCDRITVAKGPEAEDARTLRKGVRPAGDC